MNTCIRPCSCAAGRQVSRWRGRRRALEREILATWAGVVIRYTGWRLDQADLDVWLSALHLAREHPLGEPVSVRINAVLRAMGRPTAARTNGSRAL